ncbi:hypothetical protein HYW76_00105 [Candidatus Pacearchaeota archaeon]|nr:hypothetical protein [Candidatus Pacearchaeota archaeon]
MKQSELIRKVEMIRNQISASGLIARCINVAQKLGKKVNTSDFKEFTYHSEKLHVGCVLSYLLGDGLNIHVLYEVDGSPEKVFLAESDFGNTEEISCGIRDEKYGNFRIMAYRPGGWEAQLKALEESIPAAGEISKEDREISSEELEHWKDQFSGI